MKNLLSAITFSLFAVAANAQNVGIGTPTPNPRAILDLTSTNKGFLLPRVVLTGTTDNTTIPNAPYGLMVINQSEIVAEGAGVYIQTGLPAAPIWRRLGLATGGWALQGNSGATGAVLGHLDSRPLQFVVGGSHVARLGANSNILLGLNSGAALPQTSDFSSHNNIAIGNNAMATATAGTSNIAIGNLAMNEANGGSTGIAIGGGALNKQSGGALENIAIGFSSQATTTSGTYNLSLGRQSLFKNTIGSNNVAQGSFSLESNTTGSGNIAVGYLAANKNTTGFSNIAIGASALFSNTLKSNLVAIGDSALYHNNGGEDPRPSVGASSGNTAVGSKALYQNTVGSGNTALGFSALRNNTNGFLNTAIGHISSRDNILGNYNTSVGVSTLQANRFSSFNVAIGNSALYLYNAPLEENGNNVAIGAFALLNQSAGVDNVALGRSALADNYRGSKNTAIGYGAGERSMYGSGNVFIGNEAGYFADNSSNKLYIENSNKDSLNALIYGDFTADSLLLNAKTINKFSLNIRGSNALEMGYGTAGKQTDAGKIQYGGFGDPAHWLAIVGGGTNAVGNDRVIKLWSEGGLRIKGNALPDLNNTYSLGTSGQRWSAVWTNAGAINTSDANLKTNITTSPYGLSEVMQMNPVQYNWKTNPKEDLQIGFLAQDILKIIPEAVVVPANGDPLGMKYTELIPVLVKAIQELQKQNFDMQKQIDTLKAQKQ
jgi:hypothetical protein